MRCFELRDDQVVEGLLIDECEGSPRINVTTDGELYLPLGADTARFFLHHVAKVAPVRLTDGYWGKDKESITGYARSQDRDALVCLDISAGEGGHVTLTSGVHEQMMMRNEVSRMFQIFPPIGVRVLNEFAEPEPWIEGVTRLQLALLMQKGAQFRIHRTGRLNGQREWFFLNWNGKHLYVTPKDRKKETEERREEKPLRKETLILQAVS